MYQRLLKEGNRYHNDLRCPDIRNKFFEILSSAIALDKVDMECAETVISKTTGYDSGFIHHPNKIYYDTIWLDNIGYIMNQWRYLVK